MCLYLELFFYKKAIQCTKRAKILCDHSRGKCRGMSHRVNTGRLEKMESRNGTGTGPGTGTGGEAGTIKIEMF